MPRIRTVDYVQFRDPLVQQAAWDKNHSDLAYFVRRWHKFNHAWDTQILTPLRVTQVVVGRSEQGIGYHGEPDWFDKFRHLVHLKWFIAGLAGLGLAAFGLVFRFLAKDQYTNELRILLKGLEKDKVQIAGHDKNFEEQLLQEIYKENKIKSNAAVAIKNKLEKGVRDLFFANSNNEEKEQAYVALSSLLGVEVEELKKSFEPHLKTLGDKYRNLNHFRKKFISYLEDQHYLLARLVYGDSATLTTAQIQSIKERYKNEGNSLCRVFENLSTTKSFLREKLETLLQNKYGQRVETVLTLENKSFFSRIFRKNEQRKKISFKLVHTNLMTKYLAEEFYKYKDHSLEKIYQDLFCANDSIALTEAFATYTQTLRALREKYNNFNVSGDNKEKLKNELLTARKNFSNGVQRK